jgi:BirA family transcriptional regulator, biotin operon repressor / biotin---[acetyl-CoA-carboxylase] ligase
VFSVLKFHIRKYPELESTQTYARRHLGHFKHGDVIIAGKQTAGIGQYGRSWFSPDSGNIYLTMVLETEKPMPDLPEITLLAAQAVVESLGKLGIGGSVKPPNDVLVQGKKIAGIIGNFIPADAGAPGGKLLLGVGINVNMTAAELEAIGQPATSLAVLQGREQAPEPVLDLFLAAFQARYSR